MWLYPQDENGYSLMASPDESFDDYLAYKKGILRPLPDPHNSRKKRKEFREKLNKAVDIPDDELWSSINELIRKDLRQSSYNILKEAKSKKHAVIAYYNYVNAFNMYKSGKDSYGNICCMAIDWAKELLKKK